MLTLPLVGRVASEASGVEVGVRDRGGCDSNTSTPTPAPCALRASGADPPHKGEGKNPAPYLAPVSTTAARGFFPSIRPIVLKFAFCWSLSDA